MISIVFFGTDQYSKIVLEHLKKDKNLKILLVVDNKERLTDVLKLSQKPDAGILASFGAIIPEEILNFPKMGILNIHPSILPKYRGATPVPSAILAGEKETGVTIIKLDEKVDHGPVAAQTKEEIKPGDTAQTLLARLFTIGAQILLPILPDYVAEKIELREQDHSRATFTKRLSRDDGQINWTNPDDYNERFVRAMTPWPGAWTVIQMIDDRNQMIEKRLKILKAHLENGKLVLDLVQLEGKKPVSWKQFQEGYPEVKITP